MTEPTPLEQLAAYGEAMQEGDPAAVVTRSTVAKLLAAAFHVMADKDAEMSRSLAEKDAEIARLRAELDELRDAPVEYVPTAGIEAALDIPGREDRAMIRETGGQKRAFEWKAAAKTWEQAT